MELSRIGLGTVALGGMWGFIDEKSIVDTVVKSLDNGINWIDTSPIYGDGYAESIIGKISQKRRAELFIATKCGLFISKDGVVKRDLTPASIFKEIDISLKNLNFSEIDLYQCHWPDFKTYIEETWEAMAWLVKQGKVKHIGVCNFNLKLLKRIYPIYPVYSIQLPYNMIQKEIDKSLIEFCIAHNIKILGYSPLQSGILSGNFSLEKLSPKDKRLRFNHSDVNKYISCVKNAYPIAKKMGISFAQLAITWVLQNKDLYSTIVGVSSTSQVQENIMCLRSRSISDEDMKLIEKAFANSGSTD